MTLRIAEQLWEPLCDALLARQDVESAGLLFGEALPSADGQLIVAREALAMPEASYLIRRRDQLSLDPISLNRLMRPARERGWSVFTVHTHPGASVPWFSPADDAGDARFMPSLATQLPGVPHGSLVLVSGGIALARAFEGATSCEIPLQIVGRTLKNAGPRERHIEPWFHRQALALGAHGQAQLRRLRVGIVGLGGIGSLVSMQLAHLGVGELVLIDGDVVEVSNLSRVTGATRADVGQSYKVDIAARYVRSVGLVERVQVHREFLTREHQGLLGSCDVIISCVDLHTPRALLNRLAYRYCLPVIDLGTVFRVDASGAIAGDAGRVVVLGPGRPCLACWGHIDPHALRVEALSPEERDGEIDAGYIQGAVEAQPSVIAFNTVVAGAGVIELIRLATAFAGSDSPPLRLAFSFTEGTVRRNVLAHRIECKICGQ